MGRDVSVGALAWWRCYLGPAWLLRRTKRMKLPRGSWEVGRTEKTLDWSLVGRGWSYRMANGLQSVLESD